MHVWVMHVCLLKSRQLKVHGPGKFTLVKVEPWPASEFTFAMLNQR